MLLADSRPYTDCRLPECWTYPPPLLLDISYWSAPGPTYLFVSTIGMFTSSSYRHAAPAIPLEHKISAV